MKERFGKIPHRAARVLSLLVLSLVMTGMFALAAQAYTLTVIGGSGSGDYPQGQRVRVRADEGAFVSWEVTSGNVELINPSADIMFFEMPAADVTLTARFEGDAPAPADAQAQQGSTEQASDNSTPFKPFVPGQSETQPETQPETQAQPQSETQAPPQPETQAPPQPETQAPSQPETQPSAAQTQGGSWYNTTRLLLDNFNFNGKPATQMDADTMVSRLTAAGFDPGYSEKEDGDGFDCFAYHNELQASVSILYSSESVMADWTVPKTEIAGQYVDLPAEYAAANTMLPDNWPVQMGDDRMAVLSKLGITDSMLAVVDSEGEGSVDENGVKIDITWKQGYFSSSPNNWALTLFIFESNGSNGSRGSHIEFFFDSADKLQWMSCFDMYM